MSDFCISIIYDDSSRTIALYRVFAMFISSGLVFITGELLIGEVLLFDDLCMQWESIQLLQNPICPICKNH